MKLSCIFLLIFTIWSCCFKISVCLWPNFRILTQNSLPPSPSPEAAPPSPSRIFNKNTPSSMETINVLSFGAIGDGVTDDTKAFKMAWDSACQSDSAILLVPSFYTFMVQSTIFTGPCKSGIVFQVTCME